MRLSESLRKNVFETTAGGITNKFRIKKRRTTLFFEDILALYIRLCESGGHPDEMFDAGKEWGALGTTKLGKLRMFHSITLLNKVMNSVWNNIGLIDDFSVVKKGRLVTVRTRNEFITRVIGPSRFMEGFFAGCALSFLGREVRMAGSKASGGNATYVYEVLDGKSRVEGKDKETYNRMNSLPQSPGLTLKKSIEARVFSIRGNMIYFRGKSVIPVENTIFHILGARGILMDRVADISSAFFSGVLKEDATAEGRLLLLKNLMQTMGWCRMRIVRSGSAMRIEIDNLPVGLQKSKDNWAFLAFLIIGYIRAADKNLSMRSVAEGDRKMTMVFGR